VFTDELANTSFKKYMMDLMKTEVECRAAGYDMNGTRCLEDYLSKLPESSSNEFTADCQRFASRLKWKIQAYKLNRDDPLDYLGRQHPWLKTAARNCRKVKAALKQLNLFKKGESKMNES
jgi:hypothetical protein